MRPGAAQGSATAIFEPEKAHAVWALLADQAMEGSEEIVLRRTLAGDGRSRAFVQVQIHARLAELREEVVPEKAFVLPIFIWQRHCRGIFKRRADRRRNEFGRLGGRRRRRR